MGSFFPPSPQPPSTSFFMQIQPLSEEEEGHNNNNSQNLFPSASLTHLQDYHGMASLLGKRSMSLHSGLDKHGFEEMNGVEDEFSDDCSQLGEKKRRLSMNQVRTLEKNFEVGNKLEPERKMQLARVLGLQPRQIAIWFQNRRARWKTKQLERDYDVLKKQFEAIQSENDDLHAHNKKLQEQIMSLNGREMSSEKPTLNLNKETEVSCSYRTENNNSNKNSDIKPPPPPNNEDLINNPSDQNMSFFPTINPHFLQCPKIENSDAADVGSGGDDSFCNNMFCSLDDQAPGFWTSWQEQQTFH